MDKFDRLNACLKLDQVPKFTQIRIEATSFCGYNCFMCPRDKMTRKAGKMSMDDLNRVIDVFDYINYECDVHMHNYGESLLCGDLPERIELVSRRKANFAPCLVSTLGYKKERRWLEALFANGLKELIVSFYGYDRDTYKAVHGVDCFDLARENLAFIAGLQSKYGFKLTVQLDGFGNFYPLPKEYSSEKLAGLRDDFLVYLKEIGIVWIGGLPLHNHGGR